MSNSPNPQNPEILQPQNMYPPQGQPVQTPLPPNAIPAAGQPISEILNKPVDPRILNQPPVQSGPPKAELKRAAMQVMGDPAAKRPEPKPQAPKAKDPAAGAKKSNSKMIYAIAFVVMLLIPMPKQIGGEIEIEGTPASNQALIRPTVGGTVKEVLVKTGQEVRKGQVLAVLNNWEIEEKVVEGEKQLARLEASLGPLQAQGRVAQQEYQRAQEDYNRQKAESDYVQTQAKGLAPDASAPPRIQSTRKQLEQIRLQAESLSQKAALHKYLADEGVFPKQSALQTAYEAASATKQSQALASQLAAEELELKQRSVEDVPKLKESSKATAANYERYQSVSAEMKATMAQIAGLRKQVELYKMQRDDLVLRSPIDGTLLTLKTDSLIGQNFNKGDTVAVVGNLELVKVKIQLPEEERAFVKVGQDVTARFRAVTDQVFAGKVYQVAPVTSETGEQTNKRRIWEIHMYLKNSQRELLPGMTGYAKISTGQWRSLLVLAWDEVYKSFRLDRYIDRNPFASLMSKKAEDVTLNDVQQPAQY